MKSASPWIWQNLWILQKSGNFVCHQSVSSNINTKKYKISLINRVLTENFMSYFVIGMSEQLMSQVLTRRNLSNISYLVIWSFYNLFLFCVPKSCPWLWPHMVEIQGKGPFCTDARFTLRWTVCLWLSSQSRIFHSYGYVIITGEGLQNLSYAWHSIVAIEQWGFFNVPHPLWHGISIYYFHLWGTMTLTTIAERGAVSTCFYNLGLSQLGFEHPNLPLVGPTI